LSSRWRHGRSPIKVQSQQFHWLSETGAYPIINLKLQKSPTPDFEEKTEIPRPFKEHFSIGNVQVRILRGQPGSALLGENACCTRKEARQWRGLRISDRSPGSDFGYSQSEIADSLWRTFENSVFGKLRSETGCELHWMAHAAVKSVKLSALVGSKLGMSARRYCDELAAQHQR
jgi:hypothetical protein